MQCNRVAPLHCVLLISLAFDAVAVEPLDPGHAAKMARSLEVFKSDVAALLAEHCLQCHGGESVKAGFDLRDRDALLKGGDSGPAVIAGDARQSLLMQLVRHERDPHMPAKKPRLSDQQIQRLTQWIDLGAAYDKPLAGGLPEKKPGEVTESDRRFWSFLPLDRVEPPAVQSPWVQSPIDRFVLEKLRELGAEPNPQADRRTLIRRLYFDMIGMPPTPEQVASFLSDSDPRAYANRVDQLLEDPRFGERWARHWLDVVRFAESSGFEQDSDRPFAYWYRDFVIHAFNSDMPYDRFVQWQLAGDEMAPGDPWATAATGFLVAGVFPTQLTEAEFESSRYDQLDDMLATTGTAFLGLTIGCARCHDHKYDPIPVKDYYHLASSFTTAIPTEAEVDITTDAQRQAILDWQVEHDKLKQEVLRFESQQLTRNFERWLDQPEPAQPEGDWVVLEITQAQAKGGATFTAQEDGSQLVGGSSGAQDHYTLTATTHLQGITAIRLDALTHPSLPRNGPGRAPNGNFGLSDLKLKVTPLKDPSKARHVKLVSARATHEQNRDSLSVAAAIDDQYGSGWAVDGGIGKDQAAVFVLQEPIHEEGGVTLSFEMNFMTNTHHNIGRPRWSVRVGQVPQEIPGPVVGQHVVEGLAALKQGGKAALTPPQRTAMLKWYGQRDPQYKSLKASLADHAARQPQPHIVKVMACSEGVKPIKHFADDRGFPHFYKQTHHLNRGDVRQKQGVASQGFLQVLMRDGKQPQHWKIPPSEGSGLSHRRSSLAGWITDTDHGAGHLLARVIVNRLWQHHLGRGLVATPSDFGFQGERPTHPQLLDWLAGELVASGWSLKHVHRLILNSATYKQDGTYDDRRAALDMDNKHYWRRAPRRLEAEAVRDTMLCISGRLDSTPYGPGTLDLNHARRSIYFFQKRSQLIPMMMVFDAPDTLQGIAVRPQTTIAPQALAVLNSPLVRGYTEAFAGRLTEGGETPVERSIALAYEIALNRAPSRSELSDAKALIESSMTEYESRGPREARLHALADFCQVLMGLNEFIYID